MVTVYDKGKRIDIPDVDIYATLDNIEDISLDTDKILKNLVETDEHTDNIVNETFSGDGEEDSNN